MPSFFLSILIPVAFICLVFFGWWYNSPRQKGKRGEQRVYDVLSNLSEEYHILDDVILKTKNGTTQIDHIIVSKYGIFTIETKNYRGDIYGEDYRKEWTQLIVTNVTYPKKWWKTYTYVKKNRFYHVIYKENLLEVISRYKAIYIKDDDVQTILDIIKVNNVRETVSNKQHVKNLKNAAKVVNTAITFNICPKCGGHLVERRGQYGTFYGCSNYPQCRFTVRHKHV